MGRRKYARRWGRIKEKKLSNQEIAKLFNYFISLLISPLILGILSDSSCLTNL